MAIRSLVLCLYIFLTFTTVYGSIAKITHYIPSDLELKQGKMISYEYCPDNTCEVFVSTPERREKLEDITILYLYYFSGYIYLEKWRNESATRAQVIKILDKYMGKRGLNEKNTAKSIITKLSKAINLEFYFVRYDEGKKNTVPVNIKRRLN